MSGQVPIAAAIDKAFCQPGLPSRLRFGQYGDEAIVLVSHGSDGSCMQLDLDAGLDAQLLQDEFGNFGIVHRATGLLRNQAAAGGKLLKQLGHDP